MPKDYQIRELVDLTSIADLPDLIAENKHVPLGIVHTGGFACAAFNSEDNGCFSFSSQVRLMEQAAIFKPLTETQSNSRGIYRVRLVALRGAIYASPQSKRYQTITRNLVTGETSFQRRDLGAEMVQSAFPFARAGLDYQPNTKPVSAKEACRELADRINFKDKLEQAEKRCATALAPLTDEEKAALEVAFVPFAACMPMNEAAESVLVNAIAAEIPAIIQSNLREGLNASTFMARSDFMIRRVGAFRKPAAVATLRN